MTDDFDGSDLIDTGGDKVGTIDRTYVDDSGVARFVSVKIGALLGKHHLVPAERAQEVDQGIQVPYLKDVIEESPAVDSGDTLEGETLGDVRAYYADYEQNGAGDDAQDEDTQNLGPGAITAIGEADDRSRPADDLPTIAEDTATTENFGKIRDLGDVIEVPVVEEVVVKKPIVREVLRIKKSRLVETGTAAADLRKEQVEVVPSSGELISEDSDITEGPA